MTNRYATLWTFSHWARCCVPEYKEAYREFTSSYVTDQNGVIIYTDGKDILSQLDDYKLQYDLLKSRKKVCL